MKAEWTRPLFQSVADHTAHASSASEGSLLAGTNLQPVLPAFFWGTQDRGKSLHVRAAGVFSTTGTPTLTFQLRLGPTAGSAYLSGTSIGVSAAITTSSGVTNKPWFLEYHVVGRTPGIGTTNATLSGYGLIWSGGGFASPFFYHFPDGATWTYTLDGGLTQYFQISCTWSASSASNTITLKDLEVLESN